MRYIKILLIFILLFLPFYVGCKDVEKKQYVPMTYEQATQLAIEYVVKSGYYKKDDFRVLNEPNNYTWNWYSSRNPKMLEEYGLNDKDYYAIYFYKDLVRDSDSTVFINKDGGMIIGIFCHGEFIKKEK